MIFGGGSVKPSTNCSSSSPVRVERTCLRHEGKLFAVSLMGKLVVVESWMTVVEVAIAAAGG